MSLTSTCAVLLCACATPLGPGYTINQQHFDLQWIGANHVLVRASYRLQNTGNQPLDYIEVTLPPEARRRELKLTLEGAAVAPQSAGHLAPADSIRIPLHPAWPKKKKGDLTIEYAFAAAGFSDADTAGALFTPNPPQADEGPAATQQRGETSAPLEDHTAAFYLEAGGWYPELLAHSGLLGSGGDAPEKWDLRVTAPRDFLVHASGEHKGSKRRNGSLVHRFRHRRAEHLFPFVLAGRFQPHEVRSNVLRASLWAAGDIDESAARMIIQRIAQAISVLESRFGPRSGGAESLLFINGPQAASPAAGQSEPHAVTFPDAVWTAPGLFGAARDQQAAFCAADRIVARLWFHHLARPDADAHPLAEVLTARAASLIPGGCDPAAAPDFVANQLSRHDEAKASMDARGDQPVETVHSASAQLENAKLTLFVAALESRLGRDVLNASLKRMLQSLRGRTWTTNDLRVAIHIETGGDPQDFFRQWLHHPGIPQQFRNM